MLVSRDYYDISNPSFWMKLDQSFHSVKALHHQSDLLLNSIRNVSKKYGNPSSLQFHSFDSSTLLVDCNNVFIEGEVIVCAP